MTAATQERPIRLDTVGALAGEAGADETDVRKRVAACLGVIGTAGTWEPTPLGETIATSVVALVVRSAPDRATGLAAYIACEEDEALDRIMDAMQRAVVRELRKVAAA